MELAGEDAFLIGIVEGRLCKQYIDLYVAVLTHIVQYSVKVFLLLGSELVLRYELGKYKPLFGGQCLAVSG